MCVYVYVYVCACVRKCTTRALTRAHVDTHTHTHTHTHTAQAFNKLEAHVRAIMQFRFGIGMVDTLVAKYMATVVKRKKKRK